MNEDLLKHSSFQRVLNEGMFNIRGDAAIPAALLFDWYRALGARIKKDIEYQEAKAKADYVMHQDGTVEKKPIGDPIAQPIRPKAKAKK